VKKGRHRRFEEARALKRSGPDIDIESLLGSDKLEEEHATVNGRAGWFEDEEVSQD
jgi:hypothetical protein